MHLLRSEQLLQTQILRLLHNETLFDVARSNVAGHRRARFNAAAYW